MPTELALSNAFAIVLFTWVFYKLGDKIAARVGRDRPRVRLHGRYVLAWMVWAFFVGGMGRTVYLLLTRIDHGAIWMYVPVWAYVSMSFGWPVGMIHGWVMLPPAGKERTDATTKEK